MALTKVSASQLETFDGSRESCYRKWAFGSVWKLPQAGDNSAQNFGTVLHAVVERYLKADELGRDNAGNAVNLYPEGWYIAEDRWGRKGEPLEEKDRFLVQTLVEKGIREGVVQRHLQRRIEHPSDYIVPELQDVQVAGFIDLFAPHRIEDHKTTGNLKYTKSSEALKTNTQMVVYGKYLLLEHQNVFGIPYSNNITFRHNIFLKDYEEPQVIGREAIVSPQHIETEWLTFVPRIAKMRDLRAKLFGTNADTTWESVEAQNVPSSCRAFGGCPYQTICGKAEKPSEYTFRVSQFNQNKNKTIDSLVRLPVVTTGGEMNFFELAKAQGITPTTTATQPIAGAAQYIAPQPAPLAQPIVQAPAAASQPIAAPNPFAALIGVAAPVAQAAQYVAVAQPATPMPEPTVTTQVVATGPTFTATTAPAEPPKKKRGRPSKADLAARAAAQQAAPSFASSIGVATPEADDEGEDEVDDESLPTAFSPAPAQQAIAPSQNPSPVAAIPPAPVAPTAQAAPVIQNQPGAPTGSSVVTHTASAPVSQTVTHSPAQQVIQAPAGVLFWLFENCTPQKVPPATRVVYTSELLRQIALQMSQDVGKSFYDIDDFTRRNCILKYAEQIVATYLQSGDLVVSDIDNPDNAALLTAIKPFAMLTARGTR